MDRVGINTHICYKLLQDQKQIDTIVVEMGCINSSNRHKRPNVSVREKVDSTYDPRLSIIGGTRPNNLNKVFLELSMDESIGNRIQWDDHEEILSALILQLPEDTYIYPFTKYSLVTQVVSEKNPLEPLDEGEVKGKYEERTYALVDTKDWESLVTTNYLTISEVGYYMETPGKNQDTEMRLFYVTSDKGCVNLVTPVFGSDNITLQKIDITKVMAHKDRSVQLNTALKSFVEGLGVKNVFIKARTKKNNIWHFVLKSEQTTLYWTVKEGKIVLTSKIEEAAECKMENLTQSINFD